MNKNARFCSKCGAETLSAAPASTAPRPYHETTPVFTNGEPPKPKKKMLRVVSILLTVLIVSGLVTTGVVLSSRIKNKDPEMTTKRTDMPSVPTESLPSENPVETSPSEASDSALVSSGVRSSDIGNIMNGQFYFAIEDRVFYSSFDTDDKAHIYTIKKDGTDRKVIFDGFGWSLVVIEDWLYFTGNAGATIDGTYNIFRIKLDGSQVEQIIKEYSYGMFFYDGYLYYMKSRPDYPDSMSICRASPDGLNEEILFPNGNSPIVYQNFLYYHDNQGNMFRTRPDGTDPEVILTAAVETYVISDDKIIFNDHDHNIFSCDLDGKNLKLVRGTAGVPINRVNAYNGRVFFSEYNPDFNYTAYGFNYTVKSCRMDGSEEREVFSSVSYGIYMNLVDNKLMMMDYVMNATSGVMYASIKVMDLDGNNVDVLAR